MAGDERDTQFQFFANALYEEIDPLISELCYERADTSNLHVAKAIQKLKQRLAQRAYDFAEHIVQQCEGQEDYHRRRLSAKEMLINMPDFPEE